MIQASLKFIGMHTSINWDVLMKVSLLVTLAVEGDVYSPEKGIFVRPLLHLLAEVVDSLSRLHCIKGVHHVLEGGGEILC